MHLEKPYLTTTGKKKGKKKFASADAKRKSEKLTQEWEELMKKWSPKPVVKRKFKTESLSPKMLTPRITGTELIPSLVTPGGSCSKKEANVYTGNNVLGIAVMHKSCLQPVFSEEEAVEISRMRRG